MLPIYHNQGKFQEFDSNDCTLWTLFYTLHFYLKPQAQKKKERYQQNLDGVIQNLN